jgi:hypothetical protein
MLISHACTSAAVVYQYYYLSYIKAKLKLH